MTQMLEAFVQQSGGAPVFTWTEPAGPARTRALILCTNEAGTALVLAALDHTGDGAVLTLQPELVEQLVDALATWLEQL